MFFVIWEKNLQKKANKRYHVYMFYMFVIKLIIIKIQNFDILPVRLDIYFFLHFKY